MIVHANIFRTGFGYGRNSQLKVEVVECESNRCDLRDDGNCLCLKNGSCPYGKRNSLSNSTYVNKDVWNSTVKQVYGGYKKLKPYKDFAIVGEYVFIPRYLKLCDKTEVTNHRFILLEHWTVEFVVSLIENNPETYKDFIHALYLKDRNMYSRLIRLYPKYNIELNFVGREAYIVSLKPDTIFFINGREFEWDGEYVYNSSNQIISSFFPEGETEIRIKPKPSETVKILDNSWVDENTEFVN